jgi:hypothetical protein
MYATLPYVVYMKSYPLGVGSTSPRHKAKRVQEDKIEESKKDVNGRTRLGQWCTGPRAQRALQIGSQALEQLAIRTGPMVHRTVVQWLVPMID